MKFFAILPFSGLNLILSAFVGASVAIVSHVLRTRRDRIRQEQDRAFRQQRNHSAFPDIASISSSPPDVRKTILRPDGLQRLVIFERHNGTFGFLTQSKREIADDWPPFFRWSEGGVYDSIATAEREASIGRRWQGSGLVSASG